MTAFELPEEYRDWVEVPGDSEMTWPSLMVRLEHREEPNHTTVKTSARYFAPPKPKPTLPKVRVGGVVRWTQKPNGPVHVSVKLDRPGWHDYTPNVMLSWMHGGNEHQRITDVQMLAAVNDDGFTVLLEGL